jgi:hypothetical protein
MTDIEVYKKFMSWIGMEIVEQIELENGNKHLPICKQATI